MGTGFSKRKKQARMMQEQFMRMQEELKNKKITGSAGNGLVTLVINWEHKVESIKIKPDCVDPEDVEGLEDLIKAAFEDAQEKLEQEEKESGGMPNLEDITGGLGGFF